MSETGGRKNDPGILLTFALSGMAGCVAELCTFPMDMLRTRLQIHGGTSSQKMNTYKMFQSIVQSEGFFKLWSGISASLCRQFVYSGSRLAIYGWIRAAFQKSSANPNSFPVWKAALSGAIAGGCGQFLASPLELIKVQMQMDGLRELKGEERRIRNVFQGLKKVYSEGGIRSVFRGSLQSAQRGTVVNIADIGGYDSIKRLLHGTFNMQNQFAIQCLSGMGSAFLGTSMACPIEVVKNRIMNQPVDKDGKGKYYRGGLDCMKKTLEKEGARAFYKGFMVMWLRKTPFGIIFWNVLEFERYILGLSQF